LRYFGNRGGFRAVFKRRNNFNQGETMKKLLIVTCALGAAASIASGGTETYSGKNVQQSVQQTPCPEWYRDQEWNVSLWGTYAFTGEDWANDRYLEVDHAWGGGIDAKYFFGRYFGIGVEGFGLAVSDRSGVVFAGTNLEASDLSDRGAVGGVLGTFTLRYPIPCTRFAPYVFGGGGGIFGGGGRTLVLFDNNGNVIDTQRNNSESKIMGQVGGGFEVRFTPSIGWMSDFSWNVVDGPSNNFGMARTGINFAF
jgi:hypothetical protein